MTTATLTRNKLVARIRDQIDLQALGGSAIRYGLVAVVGWIGLMKFTHYEAEGIRPFVANSPLLSWAYTVLSVDAFAALLGVAEVAIAGLIALRPLSARASAVGSALAVGMFATTLSFLLTTPGVWEPTLGGFPALSAVPGQFLLKDIVLLGAALWTLGEALHHRHA
jgi:reactive chlorine resistance protein C